jgi:hypothetical protein
MKLIEAAQRTEISSGGDMVATRITDRKVASKGVPQKNPIFRMLRLVAGARNHLNLLLTAQITFD